MLRVSTYIGPPGRDLSHGWGAPHVTLHDILAAGRGSLANSGSSISESQRFGRRAASLGDMPRAAEHVPPRRTCLTHSERIGMHDGPHKRAFRVHAGGDNGAGRRVGAAPVGCA